MGCQKDNLKLLSRKDFALNNKIWFLFWKWGWFKPLKHTLYWELKLLAPVKWFTYDLSAAKVKVDAEADIDDFKEAAKAKYATLLSSVDAATTPCSEIHPPH